MKTKLWIAALCLLAAFFFVLPARNARAESPTDAVKRTAKMIREAVAQYTAGDHTPLDEPVTYRMLWLGYTRVYYDQLDFRMTEADREYLRAVRNNFILYVENITNHCLKVEIDLYFIDDVTPLTRWEGDDWLYLKRDTVLGKVREYDEKKTGGYDTVITFVETEGAGNESRNRNKPGYGVHYVMLGLMTHGLRDDIGYSTVSLGQPDPQYYPQPDPAAPTLMGTAVAVHEWLHQLEYLGEVMGVEYPNTHAYTGEYPGYRKYLHNEKQFDQFEFYSLVLQGKLPYTKDGKTRLVGMYPRMWKLAKRNALNLGKYYIGNGKGMYLTPGNVEPYVILSEFKIPWLLRYGPDGRVIIHPWQPPYLPEDWRLDLDNAYDADGTWVKIIYNTGWLDAQSWYLTKNSDGSFCIRTAMGSLRALTALGPGQKVVIRAVKNNDSPESAMRWFFTEAD